MHQSLDQKTTEYEYLNPYPVSSIQFSFIKSQASLETRRLMAAWLRCEPIIAQIPRRHNHMATKWRRAQASARATRRAFH